MSPLTETRLAPAHVVQDEVDAFDMLGAWLDWLEARDLSEHTVQLYVYGVFRFFKMHHFPAPGTVTEAHIAAFLKSLKGRDTARIHYFRGVRSAFGYWVRKGWIPVDPTVDIRLRKPYRGPPVALTEEELTRYLIAAAWRNPRRAWTLMLVFGIGGRRMEAAEIRPDDIEGDVVNLRVCKYHKTRRVELSPYAKVALEELGPWWNGTVLGGISKSTITGWANEAAHDSGLYPKLRGRVAHVLRASFISRLLSAGVPVQVVRDLAGHENIATTNSYAATFDHQRREAVALLT